MRERSDFIQELEQSERSRVIALIVGRYQPFHNGHLKVMIEALDKVDQIIIGIGSAQYSGMPDNPFSYEERKLMIEISMEMEGIDASRYSTYPIDDIHNYPLWVAHVRSRVPYFDLVYSRSELTKRLFGEAGIEVREPYLYDRKRYSGTEIRRRMIEGEEWQDLVPRGTYRIVHEIDGVCRLRDIMANKEDRSPGR